MSVHTTPLSLIPERSHQLDMSEPQSVSSQSYPSQPTQPASRRVNRATVILIAAIVVLGATTGLLYYQLNSRLDQANSQIQQTNSQLQQANTQLHLRDTFHENCVGNFSSDFSTFTETCNDSYGDVCTFTSTTSGTSYTSTSSCHPTS